MILAALYRAIFWFLWAVPVLSAPPRGEETLALTAQQVQFFTAFDQFASSMGRRGPALPPLMVR